MAATVAVGRGSSVNIGAASNVRVAVRVRPLLAKERFKENHGSVIRFVKNEPQLIIGKDRSFTFDYVFQPEISQSEVFDSCVSPLVEGFFEGYNATVFAYGQTGTGKTFTMGSANAVDCSPEDMGVIPRSIRQIFDIIEEQRGTTDYLVRVSFIEIYQEEFQDLLDRNGDKETAGRRIKIQENDATGRVYLSGVTEEKVSCMEDVARLLKYGCLLRSTGATGMNERSSRSHAILTITLEQRFSTETFLLDNERTDMQSKEGDNGEAYRISKFHLVDLAGSERARRTGNVGTRFKESVTINSGLLALGNVISALGDPRRRRAGSAGSTNGLGHVPYRDSKLTRFLKDSLGGNSQTLMVTCLSPSDNNYEESLNSLKYANRARNIRNRPVVNTDPDQADVERMHSEIAALKLQLTRRAEMEANEEAEVDVVQRALEIERTEDALAQLRKENEKITKQQRLLIGDLATARANAEYEHNSASSATKKVNRLLLACDECYGNLCELSQFALRVKKTGVLGKSQIQELSRLFKTMRESSVLRELGKGGGSLISGIPEQRINSAPSYMPVEGEGVSVAERRPQGRPSSCTSRSSGRTVIHELGNPDDNCSEILALPEDSELAVLKRRALCAEQAAQTAKDELIEAQADLKRDEDIFSDKLAEIQNLRAQNQTLQTQLADTEAEKSKPALEHHLARIQELMAENRALRRQQATSRDEVATIRDSSNEIIDEAIGEDDNDIDGCNTRESDNDDGQENIILPATTPRTCDSSRTALISPASYVRSSRSCSSQLAHDIEDEDTVLVDTEVTTAHDKDADSISISTKAIDDIKINDPVEDDDESHGQNEEERGTFYSQQSGFVTEKTEAALVSSLLGSSDSKARLQELSLNIKLKEELVRELVKTNSETALSREEFKQRVIEMEHAVATATAEQARAEKRLLDVQRNDAEARAELQADYEAKLFTSNMRMKNLERRRRDVDNAAVISRERSKRQAELELEVKRMRNHERLLRQKLREESESRSRLEALKDRELAGLRKDSARQQLALKELEGRNEQQRRLLTKRASEAQAAKDKLRSLEAAGGSVAAIAAQARLDERLLWLDEEVERQMKRRRAAEQLEEALQRRESVITERERVLAERSGLEIRNLRSSHAVHKDIEGIASQLDTLEAAMDATQERLRSSLNVPSSQAHVTRKQEDPASLKRQLEELSKERERLCIAREELEDRAQSGCFLEGEEHRRLLELEEAVEVLDAAMEYRNAAVQEKQRTVDEVTDSPHQDDSGSDIKDVLTRMPALTLPEAKSLLAGYFARVVELREEAHSLEKHNQGLDLALAEAKASIRDMENALRLTREENAQRQQQQVDEHNSHVLRLQEQIKQNKADTATKVGVNTSKMITEKQELVILLEKDNQYYRTVVRELKGRLRRNQHSENVDEFDTASSVAKLTTVSTRSNSVPLSEGNWGFSPDVTTPPRTLKRYYQQGRNKVNSTNRERPLTGPLRVSTGKRSSSKSLTTQEQCS